MSLAATAGPPNEEPKKESLDIPDPSTDPALSPGGIDHPSLDIATKELSGFSSDSLDKSWKRYTDRLEWQLRTRLKKILFGFVIVINGWWSWEVTRMLWWSGNSHSTFHLSDSVLIALVTTSIANFLGLVVIVARHLFPSDSSK
jgi:hypothetical protein